VVEKVTRDEESNVVVLEFEPGDEVVKDLEYLEYAVWAVNLYVRDIYRTLLNIMIARSISSDDVLFINEMIENLKESLELGKIIILKIAKRMGIQVG
jgi:hypothetical protein